MAAQPHFTVANFLARENKSLFKHQCFQRWGYAMSGASPMHSVIVATITMLFGLQLRGISCTTFSNDPRSKVIHHAP